MLVGKRILQKANAVAVMAPIWINFLTRKGADLHKANFASELCFGGSIQEYFMNIALKNVSKILEYKNIEWNKNNLILRKHQNELLVAYRSMDLEEVKRLQNKIVTSFSAK